MKKLMIAGVVGLCAAVTFGLESANVVGYATLNNDDPNVMLGIQFNSINASGVTFKDIKGEFEEEDTIQIAYTDSDGLIQFDEYFYFTADVGMVDEDGWYNGDFESVADTSLPRGAAMWFMPSSGASKDATISGELSKESVVRTFTEPNNMICASFPVPFNPNSTDYTWEGLTEEDTIQVAYTDSDGLIQFNEYFYFTADVGMVDEDGWYDGNFEKISEPIAIVGQGFWFMPQGVVTLTEKSPVK